MNSGKPFGRCRLCPHARCTRKSTLHFAGNQTAGRGFVVRIWLRRQPRPRQTRPLMGAAAVQGADKVVVTSDNPRLENPQDIINDILPTVSNPERVEVDRAVAIRYAVERAAANDIILIAGKGHENYQDVQGVKHHSPILKSQKKQLAERG